jgi:O-antigen ligase
LWVCALYFMSFPIDEARMKSILRLWLVFSGLLLALACFRWVAELTGMPIADTWRPADDSAAAYRVLGSGAALFLLNTLVILIYQVTARAAKRWIWVAVPVFAAAVIVLQHRSVWIGAFAAFATLYLVFPGQVRLRLARPLIAAAMFLIAVGGGLAGYGKLDSLLSSVTHSAAKVTDSKGTAEGRMYGWQQLISQVEPEEYLTGKPFGSGYERYDFPNVRWMATYDPHNFYLQTFLRTGIPGLVLFVFAYLLTLRGLLRDKDGAGVADLPPRLIFVLLVAQMAFMFPYRLPYEQAIWLGLGISMAASLARAPRSAAAVVAVAPARAETQPS